MIEITRNPKEFAKLQTLPRKYSTFEELETEKRAKEYPRTKNRMRKLRRQGKLK